MSFTGSQFSLLSRRALLSGGAGLMASVVTAPTHLGVLAQEATPARTAAASGFRLVARVLAEDWPALATTAATPAAAEEVAGSILLEALREGGFVTYFGHARTDFSRDDTDLSDLSDCATMEVPATPSPAVAQAPRA